jgi:transcriptional regulator GlxA family with amidase domain
MAITYGIYLFQEVAALDFTGPYEAFVLSNLLLNAGEVVTISEKKDPIICATGMEVIPQYTFETAPELDVLLVPGASNLDSALQSPRTAEWIQDQAKTAAYITAVCTGALVLKQAGLLDNRKATTHWQLIEELRTGGKVDVLEEMRYVRDGNIVTAQGVSAGIDMALWLIGQIHTPAHAREVRKILHYDPAPPYTAEV